MTVLPELRYAVTWIGGYPCLAPCGGPTAPARRRYGHCADRPSGPASGLRRMGPCTSAPRGSVQGGSTCPALRRRAARRPAGKRDLAAESARPRQPGHPPPARHPAGLAEAVVGVARRSVGWSRTGRSYTSRSATSLSWRLCPPRSRPSSSVGSASRSVADRRLDTGPARRVDPPRRGPEGPPRGLRVTLCSTALGGVGSEDARGHPGMSLSASCPGWSTLDGCGGAGLGARHAVRGARHGRLPDPQPDR